MGEYYAFNNKNMDFFSAINFPNYFIMYIPRHEYV
jgi:hypothetical protein